MGKGARRGKVVALLVALALVAVAVPLAGPVWEWVTTKSVCWYTRDELGHPIRTPLKVDRFSGLFRTSDRGVSWSTENGFKATEAVNAADGTRLTRWNLDGTVRKQRLFPRDDETETPSKHYKTSPPWW